jgi:1,4-dihydroxy-2-naphthoate octaprenyltransferase
MSTVLSLFGVVLFIIGTISVAAAITYTVVRVSPAKATGAKPQDKS